MSSRLRRSDPSRPGIGRRRRGRGFSYVDANGGAVDDDATLQRISELAIPPAWIDVWICADERGHLQAVGTDAAGRRQYLYHPKWGELRSRDKFRRMTAFAEALPQLREHVAELLDGDGDGGRVEPTRERVLALAVRLLDRGYFRIGSEQYAAENGTFGLLTLRRTHVTLEPPGSVWFDFPAKHGIQVRRRIEDAGAYALVEVLRRRRSGPESLFASRAPDGDRSWMSVDASDVNGFLREHTGVDCSAKDFRTWHGTVLCAIALASQAAAARERGREPGASPTARKREVAAAIRETAAFLGNTPAVCRAAYVDPRVIDRYRDARTIQPGIDRLLRLEDVEALDIQLVAEAATLRLLEDRTPQTIARAADRVIEQELGAGSAAA
jgi:DNA topoisomerase IB